MAISSITSATATSIHDLGHDKVTSICPSEQTVTVKLTPGFSFSRPVLYISTDASDVGAATLEASTYAPAMADIPTGGDDSLWSAVERIFVAINGPTGADHPHRQGIHSAMLDGRSPLNVLGGIPTIATDYSPLWDLNPYVWTGEAIAAGYRSRLTEEFDILGKVANGHLTGPGGGAFGSIGAIVNCPIVWPLPVDGRATRTGNVERPPPRRGPFRLREPRHYQPS